MEEVEYCRIPNYDFGLIQFDTLDVKQKVEEAVVLKNCSIHLRSYLTLTEAKNQLSQYKQIKCQGCGTTTQTLSDLRKDIRGQVFEQFHPSVESVQIIQGILTHKYNRKNRYTGLIQGTQKIISDFLLDMKKRYHQSNSISSIIQAQSPQQEKVIFWAYCLLDKVKITTPVRILKCNHPECYELTSLLAFRELQEKQQGEEKKQKFECSHPGCSISLDISSIQNLINGVFLDVDLLRVINKSLPCQFKFTYLPKNKQFNLESNGDDPIINKIYQSELTQQEKSEQSLEGFISQVQALTVTVMQGDILQAQEKILKQEMFKTRTINMIDPITQEFVEFPVRCTHCTQFDRCVDVRSFAATHILAKQRKQQFNKCPLCGHQYKCLTGTLSSSIVYFDQNLLSKMFKDLTLQLKKEFKYDGKQYMLDQFLGRQKFSREDYILELKAKNKSVGEFSSTQCACDPLKEIQIPLIIKDCPQKSMVDYETFYQKMVEIQFNIEEIGLILCKCSYCNQYPIKSYIKSIFYHEAFGEAMAEYKKGKIKVPSFSYDFDNKKVIMKLKKDTEGLDQTIRAQVNKFQNGFLEMMDDAEYQELFQPKYFGGKLFQIIGMQQTIVDGVVIEHNQQGIKANLDENIRNLNQNANSNLRQYKFQVTGMQVELNNEDIRLNRGTFGVQK